MTLRGFCLLLLAFVQTACFEPKKACLDIDATNFDASADEDCCCEYPQLLMNAVQRYDTLQYLPDSLYAGKDGRLFRIKKVIFYLSDFQLFQNGGIVTVSDSVNLKTYAATGNDTISRTFTDDFVLVRRAPVENEVGDFRPGGTFEKIRFRLGLSPEAERVIPQLAPSAHPLRIQSDSIWYGRDAGYVFLQAIVVRDSMATTKPDTLSFTKSELSDFFIERTSSFIHQSGGYNFTLTLTVDYKKMFEDVDWTTGDISTWKSKIATNLPNVFSVSQ